MMQNLVVEEVSSIILLRADYASFVIESASSKMIILKSGHLYDLINRKNQRKLDSISICFLFLTYLDF